MRMVGRCLGCVFFLHSFMVGVSVVGEGDVAFPAPGVTMKRHTLFKTASKGVTCWIM
jgi:hypothetical protein